jgi:hypothetical protein
VYKTSIELPKGNKPTSVTIKVNDFVEYDAYKFTKIK